MTGLIISKIPQVEAIVQTKPESDLHWHTYLTMRLIVGSAFRLIVDKIKAKKPWQRKLFTNTVHVFVFLADSKLYVPIKLMSKQSIPETSESGKPSRKARSPLLNICFGTHWTLIGLQ